jgi:L-asparaginase/Glu-tRNA(Gln) amidotransferase subunit D
LVIAQAIQYAQQEQTADSRVFFEPTIKLVDFEKIYSLRRVTKAKVSKNTAAQDLSWQKIESKLTDRLIVPTKVPTSTPYQGRLAFFGAAMALWILKPPCILI